jgi:hypothetical protein
MATEFASKRKACKLHTYEGLRVRRVRGLLAQLRSAGHVPAELEVNEAARTPVDWTDGEGRRRRLRPYAKSLWEAVTYRLDHEVDRVRRAEAAESDRRRGAHERAKRRAQLAPEVARLPSSAVEYRARVLAQARTFTMFFRGLLFGQGELCVGGVDEQSQAEIGEALDEVLDILQRARYRFDRAAADRLRAELLALDARDDDQLQAFIAAQTSRA